MRFPVHAVMAAALIISDVAQAASLSGAGAEGRPGAAAAATDDARFRRSEAAWKHIASSICEGCGAPLPPLVIVRTLPTSTRLESQAGLGVPVATASLPAETAPVAHAETAAAPAPAVRKRVARATPRSLRMAARLRKRVQLARLHRLRERRRLALARRRQEARRLLRVAQATAADPRGRTDRPVSPTSRTVVRAPRQAGPIGALALAEPSLPVRVPPQTPPRNCPIKREAALVERVRAPLCTDDR